jgi:hypothetical protein
MPDLTLEAVGHALTDLGNYRVKRAQAVAAEGGEDGISGALLLAIGLRETGGRNIEGGAVLRDGEWVFAPLDTGFFQIARKYHGDWLKRQPAVKAGTWAPVVAGHTPNDVGFCPRFEDSLRFTITELRENIAYALDSGVLPTDAVRVAVAAHNAGLGGALLGVREGDVDKHTALGDYSAWVIRHRTMVNRWLGQHPGWKV